MKKLLIAVLSVMFVCSMSLTAMANDGTVQRYTTAQTYLYENPSTSSRVLETIPAGIQINAWVDVQQNGFTNALTAANSGWIPTNCISTTPGGTSPAVIGTGGGSQVNLNGIYNQNMTLSQRCKVYPQPTTSVKNDWTMEAGTTVLVAEVTNGWAHITSPYNGYIPTCYINGWNTKANYPAGTTSWYGGYDWSTVYDYEYYKNTNSDVVKTLGTNPDVLISHFVNNGMREARKGNATFDLYNYIVSNRYLYDRYGLGDLTHYYKEACGIPH